MEEERQRQRLGTRQTHDGERNKDRVRKKGERKRE